ncbi:hypothetical protein LTS18_003234 [Coniosporium uncinatum]|uniref:Uncharacterized protein n=1 Tax=Coniosporium uncinatum TaxID=93489 RepID=A0ACC3D7A4_9PEZI|nr:hypothetical protein LTS18_003234 [Coniosporium uncinatum]
MANDSPAPESTYSSYTSQSDGAPDTTSMRPISTFKHRTSLLLKGRPGSRSVRLLFFIRLSHEILPSLETHQRLTRARTTRRRTLLLHRRLLAHKSPSHSTLNTGTSTPPLARPYAPDPASATANPNTASVSFTDATSPSKTYQTCSSSSSGGFRPEQTPGAGPAAASKKRFYRMPKLNREQSNLSLRVLMYKDGVGRKKRSKVGKRGEAVASRKQASLDSGGDG